MSWHRKRQEKKQQDKREACLILRMVELQRTHNKDIIHKPATPLERQLVADLASLEAKARATWAR